MFGHKIRSVHFDEVTVRNDAVDTCGRLTEIETNTYKDGMGAVVLLIAHPSLANLGSVKCLV